MRVSSRSSATTDAAPARADQSLVELIEHATDEATDDWNCSRCTRALAARLRRRGWSTVRLRLESTAAWPSAEKELRRATSSTACSTVGWRRRRCITLEWPAHHTLLVMALRPTRGHPHPRLRVLMSWQHVFSLGWWLGLESAQADEAPASTLDWQRQPYRAVAAMREAQLATGDYAMPLSLGLELLTTFSKHVYDAPPKVAKKAAAAKPAAAAASAAPAEVLIDACLVEIVG